jgi:CBS domain-containing protein
VHRGQALNVLRSMQVKDVMKGGMLTVQEGEPLGSMLGRMGGKTFPYLYVIGDDGHFVGLIDLVTLREAIVLSQDLGGLLVARDLVREDIPQVTPEQTLDLVSRVFGGRDLEEIPVVDPAGERLLGFVASHHLLEAYNGELMRRDVVNSIGSGLEAAGSSQIVLGDGYSMTQLEAPPELVGRSLKELDLRARMGIEVLLIHRKAGKDGKHRKALVPGPDTVMETGDALVVLGRAPDLERLGKGSL